MLFKNEKWGLVLEGGAMRGIFTAGVIDVLIERELEFTAAVGVSAGAAFGCNLKSRQSGRVLRYNLKYCRDPRYCSMRSLIKTGDMFGADFCYHQIPDKLDPFDVEAYNSDPMKFFAVCTDAETGKAVYKRLDKADSECYEWIRASASMPLVSKIVEVGGRRLTDGGIADSIPLSFMLSQGIKKNLVVLTQPRAYVKKKSSAFPLMKLSLRKYPRLTEAIANRHLKYNAARRLVFEQERKGAAVIICPEEPLPIGRIEHDPEVIQRVYDLGRQAAVSVLDKALAK